MAAANAKALNLPTPFSPKKQSAQKAERTYRRMRNRSIKFSRVHSEKQIHISLWLRLFCCCHFGKWIKGVLQCVNNLTVQILDRILKWINPSHTFAIYAIQSFRSYAKTSMRVKEKRSDELPASRLSNKYCVRQRSQVAFKVFWLDYLENFEWQYWGGEDWALSIYCKRLISGWMNQYIWTFLEAM